MLSKFFKKSVPKNDEVTFSQRVDAFWEWFSSRCEVYYQAIEDQNFDPYVQEVSQKMEELLPSLAWVFGPGEDNVGHSFTVSPEGNPYKAFLCSYLIKRAPELKGWTFYDSRQASPTFAGCKMNVAGQSVSANEIWVSPSIDEDNELIDLVCWNPAFEDLPEKDRGQITFLWLDEALGEFTVENRIGKIDINGSALNAAIPLTELPVFVEETEMKNAWEKKLPGEYYTGYNIKERGEYESKFLRSDIFTGTSLLWQISRDYAREEGQLDHPVPDLGVDFVFVVIPRKQLTKGKEIDERADLEDYFQAAFDVESSGVCLGGASGHDNVYLEMIILGGDPAMKVLKDSLKNHSLGAHASVHSFIKK